METPEENITRLIQEAVDYLGQDGIYNLALRYIDTPAIAAAGKLTAEEISTSFSVAGFAAGIKFALENFQPAEDTTGGPKA